MLRNFSFIFLILFSSSCAYYINQKADPPFKATQTFNTEDGIKISVIPSAELENYRVSKYLTVFYLELTNNSHKEITFDSNDIVLINEDGVQYNLISPENAVNIVRENSRRWYYPRISIGIGGGYHSGNFYFHGHHRWPYSYYYPYYRYHNYYQQPYYYPYYNGSNDNLSEIITDALFPGAVYPGSTLKGFIYFKKLTEEVLKVSLDIRYKGISGSERKAVTFSFMR